MGNKRVEFIGERGKVVGRLLILEPQIAFDYHMGIFDKDGMEKMESRFDSRGDRSTTLKSKDPSQFSFKDLRLSPINLLIGIFIVGLIAPLIN